MAKTILPEWEASSGPLGQVQYYYPEKRAGHRCGWTAKWITRGERGNRIMTPREWGYGDPGQMSPLEIYAELTDLAAWVRDPSGGMAGRFIASVGPTLTFVGGGFVELENTIRARLNDWRSAYPEYLASWPDASPVKTFSNGRVILRNASAWRPGWGGPVPFGEPIPLPETPAKVQAAGWDNPTAFELGEG